jgi:multidrug resistance efflux pump
MKYILLGYIFLLILFNGCQREKSAVISLDLTPSDYIEKITAPGTVQCVNTQYIKTPRLGIIQISYLAENGASVRKGDTVCILDYPELISRLETFTSQLENMSAELKKLEADNAMKLSLLEAQIENNDIQVAITSLDSVQQRFAPPLQKQLLALEQEKAMIEKMKLQKKYTAQKIISETELRGMRSRIRQQENNIRSMQEQVDMLIVTSPADGIVMHTESPSLYFISSVGSGSVGGKIEEGSTVYTDMTLLEMPDMKEMQVSVELPEVGYKRIEAGQKVKIKVNAAQNLFTTGAVVRKMLAGKNISRNSQVKTYEAIISVDSCHSLMSPGLSATCDIIVNEVKDTVVVPTIAIFEEDSIKLVYVALNNKYMPVTVETGLTNSSESIISRGLTGNETIALMKPPANLILRKGSEKQHKTSPADSNNLVLNSGKTNSK